MTKVLGTIVLLVVLLGLAVGGIGWLRGRPFTDQVPVFSASRLTSGNLLLPTQAAVFPDRVVRYKPGLIGHVEESIGIDQIASVRVKTGALYADVIIETSGASPPLAFHGLTNGAAKRLQQQILAAQAARGQGGEKPPSL